MTDPAQIVAGFYDAPAYVRRALQVQHCYEQVLEHCRRERGRLVPITRIRLGVLRAYAGDWSRLVPWLANTDQVAVLDLLTQELQPRLRTRVQPTNKARVLRRGLHDLIRSIERFNEMWPSLLTAVDLSAANQAREDYNRYFLLEKECAVRSAYIAQMGYRPLRLVTHAELNAVFPLLPVPKAMA